MSQPPHFATIFDVRHIRAIPSATPVVLAVLLLLAGIALLFLWRLRLRAQASGRLNLRVGFLALGLVVVGAFVLQGFYTDVVVHDRLARALTSGHYERVEGRIANFHPENPAGHDVESFDVDGHSFWYAGPGGNGGYHQSRPYGGGMREGLRVRIAAVDGVIVRLDTAVAVPEDAAR